MSSPIAHSMPKPVSSQIPAPNTPGLTDVPLLDFDGSTVDSPFSGTMEPEPHPEAQTALNPEAAWFGVQPDLIPSVEPVCMASPPPPSQGFFNDFSVPASLFPLYPSPMPTYSPLPHGATTADDLKLILLGISSRLDALERVVASVSGHVTRLENGLAAICEKPGPEVAIDGLKKTIKEFTSALVLQETPGMPAFTGKALPPLPEDALLVPAPLAVDSWKRQQGPSDEVLKLKCQNKELQEMIKQKDNEIIVLRNRITAYEIFSRKQTQGITNAIQATCSAFRRYKEITEEAAVGATTPMHPHSSD